MIFAIKPMLGNCVPTLPERHPNPDFLSAIKRAEQWINVNYGSVLPIYILRLEDIS